MNQTPHEPFAFPSPCAFPSPRADSGGGGDPLTEVIRQGARTLLAQAVEAEVAAWIDDHAHVADEHGHRQVVRPPEVNGDAPPRSIVTGVGPIEVTRPRVHDKRPTAPEGEHRARFTSAILPPYLRKAGAIEELIPWLYLKDVSTGDFGDALAALVGPDCPGLSASTVVRFKQTWEQEYRAFRGRDRTGKRYVYLWADGVHFNVRLEEDRTCILVLMGATPEGKKERIAVQNALPRIRTILDEPAAGRQASRTGDRPRLGHRRRGVGL